MSIKTHETKRKERKIACLSVNIGFDDIPFEKSRDCMSRYGRSAKTFSSALVGYCGYLFPLLCGELCAVSLSPMHFISYGAHGLEAMEEISALAHGLGLSVIFDGGFPCTEEYARTLFGVNTVFERKLERVLPDAVTLSQPFEPSALDAFVPYGKTVYVITEAPDDRLFRKIKELNEASHTGKSGCTFGISPKGANGLQNGKGVPMLLRCDTPDNITVPFKSERLTVALGLGAFVQKEARSIKSELADINEKFGKGTE